MRYKSIKKLPSLDGTTLTDDSTRTRVVRTNQLNQSVN